MRTVLLAMLSAALCLGEPLRIVSTAPSITEILFAVGAGDRVVGVTNFCHYPPEARTRKKIGNYTQPDFEAISALKPDLVLIQKNPIQLGAKLGRLGLNWLEVEYDSVPQIYTAIETIGKATGKSANAQAVVAKLRAELDVVRRKTEKLPRRKLAFIVGRNPGAVEGLIAAGKATYLRELIEMAGGENAFNDTAGAYPKITLEALLWRNPDVIVDMGEMSQTEGVTVAQKKAVAVLWSKYAVLKAVQQKRVYAVADDYFVVPGPRMVRAVEAFAHMLHPEAFPQ